MDLNEITELLQSAARSVGAEVTSPWFYLQLGLILAGAGIALGAGAAIRARIDITSLAMGWPAPLRLFMRVLVGSASTAVFALLMTLARVIMVHSTWPSRSYLLSVAAKPRLRLADHPPGDIGHPQRLHRPPGVAGGLAGGGVEHSRPARADHRDARLGLDRARRPAADAAAPDQARRAADRWRYG